MQNKHLLVGGAKCNRAGKLPGAVGPGSHPVTHKAQGGFLVQFSTEADKSTLFLVAQALDSSMAGVPLVPHQFLSTGGVLTLCRGEEQDRQSWKPCSLFHLPRLS